MKKIYKFLFNENTGYYLKHKYIYVLGKPIIIYMVAMGKRFLGIPSYVVTFLSNEYEDITKYLKEHNIPELK